MTIRIAKMLGLEQILTLSKNLNIYEEIPELLSVSLGAAETTLIKMTSAYAPFVNGGKKIKPNLITESKTEEEKQFLKLKEENV